MEEGLKLTALLYLSEALERQEFESCPELVAAAKELGVEQAQVDQTIALYLQGGRTAKASEAKVQKNRLRVLMEE